MRLKLSIQLVAWVAAGLAISALAFVCVTQQQKLDALRTETRLQSEKLRELDRLRTENEETRPLQNQQEEIERLRENTKDLLRLRNEVTQLRKQVAEMETLRAANAQLLQALPGSGRLPGAQQALVTAARKRGAILGIMLRPPNDPRAQSPARSGAEVIGLDANSPVANSGILPGDWIVAIDGRAIQTAGQLQAEMLTRTPGETVVLDVVRTNTVLRFQVQTRAWPEARP